MKKCFLSILVFFFNIMPIYALSFKIEPSYNSKTVSVGETVGVDIYLNDISDTNSGISACTMKISADNGIIIKDKIETYGNWQGISGSKGYSFDTIDTVLSNTKIFTVSVTVNQSGGLKFSEIVCTDVDDVQNTAENKEVVFTVESKQPSSSNPASSKPSSSASSSKPTSSKPSSSSQNTGSSSKPSSSSSSSSNNSSSNNENNEHVYLTDIIVTGGVINFNKEIFEYNIIVDDFDAFSVKPVAEKGITYDVSESLEDGLKNYLITVWDNNGASQKYIIYLTKGVGNSNNSSSDSSINNEKKNYTGVFIAIIICLLLVNIGRIGYNYYKQNKN